MEIIKGNLEEKYENIDDHWHPRIIAELNGQTVKIAKVKGVFPWHSHEHEDEMFYVVKGQLKIELRNGSIILNEGEYVVIPRGIEHQPSAEEEAQILMFEPISTINTGDQNNEFTIKDIKKL
jgi:quercetin dioxygenase-like cupin family protein